jgi:hypothetical protein
VWLLPILVGTAVALGQKLRPAALAARAGAFAAALALAALPVILPGGLLPPTSSPLDAGDAKGNLFEPLDPLQVAGIWPVGDFRLAPDAEPLTHTLVALALILAVAGTSYAWRRRAHGALFATAGAVIGVAFLVAAGSPWVDGKALATASPFVLLIALVGAAALAAGPWRAAGVAAGVAIASAVLWSNALAYRDASLAPYDQFLELEKVAEEIAGEGPTLMTEYSPYGARHFLRDANPEAVSELRRREIPLRSGGTVEKGHSTDTDRIDPGALGVYRTLVLRRSPGQSRPPSAYELAWSGEFYEVWQRPQTAVVPAERLPLGSRRDPLAAPSCAAVLHLARGADALVGATGAEPVVVSLARAEYPDGWRVAGLAETPLVAGDGSLVVDATIRRAGAYELWAEGSARSEVETFIDGERVGSVRHELNNAGQYIRLGSGELEAGRHRIELRFAGADLHPGSGGRPLPLGPLALTAGEPADSKLVHVPAAEARRLCGREWDWIEVASG